MTGFELWISGIGSDRSTNWASTTAQNIYVLSTEIRRKSCIKIHKVSPLLLLNVCNIQIKPQKTQVLSTNNL